MRLSRYAVIGYPLTHTLSPSLHHYFAEKAAIALSYEALPVEPSQFVAQVMDFFNQGGLGLNITTPFKHQAFLLCDEVSERGLKAQVVNTLWRRQSKLCGDNTDGVGFLHDISQYVSLAQSRVLIMGAGGATSGIMAPLLASNPQQVMIVNRTMARAEALKQTFPEIRIAPIDALEEEHFDVVIHATTVNAANQLPLLPEFIWKPLPFCYDLSYGINKPTPFVQYARTKGCRAIDGLGMLAAQAAEAFRVWHGVTADREGWLKAHALR